MIGGSGEKKTSALGRAALRPPQLYRRIRPELPGKVNALAKRCEEIGRDPATLETSFLLTVLLDENAKPDQIPAEMSQRMLVGSAEYIAEQVQAKVLDAGVDGVIINLPFYTPGVVTAAAEALRPLVGL